ncbi:nuclear transport factor 2 family protein [Streptomyces somaliensis]|uniref:nuclear transport factor 2 family protein n=1 Tax=Streptomyces somaliensis TaxID=78355 RepID=UPI0020CDDD7E|nr:nuclear transport factor 2 family protein [Streptomyces somaliensis]MCP9946618.1 nuclear transport factor 2 family protein [Streptomyces somaliensis]MCP9960245.1 nuclear transport factor 2 family protein [Streptomyces somaliensis]MCP9973013.1 nuclear transport factor 2 family protein [Streptomyces somaliensis]
MAVAPVPMTDEQRKAVVTAYFKAFDNGGVGADGTPVLDFFAEDADFFFPKWGLARGKAEIARMFGDLGGTVKSIEHHVWSFNWITTGTDLLAVEGTTHGEHRDGSWRVGTPEWGAGRWCGVFEVRDFLVQRAFIYLDPDYAGKDVARYTWL